MFLREHFQLDSNSNVKAYNYLIFFTGAWWVLKMINFVIIFKTHKLSPCDLFIHRLWLLWLEPRKLTGPHHFSISHWSATFFLTKVFTKLFIDFKSFHFSFCDRWCFLFQTIMAFDSVSTISWKIISAKLQAWSGGEERTCWAIWTNTTNHKNRKYILLE